MDPEKIAAVARILGNLLPFLAKLIHQAIDGDTEAVRRLKDILPRTAPDTAQRELEEQLARAKWGDE